MRGRLLIGFSLAASVLVLSGCGMLPPVGGVDRSETVPVAGGTCDIAWWLSPAVDDPPAEAEDVASAALADAKVNGTQWEEWYTLLDDDPDLDYVPEMRLWGSAYVESVRQEVRIALDEAGYPDSERVIEVHSHLSCRG